MLDNLYYYKAKVNRVVDGDTLNLTIDLGFKLYHTMNCRLARINTPELHAQEESVRESANKAKQFLSSLTQEGDEVVIRSVKLDKYGRPLIEVYSKDKNVNDIMIESGFAAKYN